MRLQGKVALITGAGSGHRARDSAAVCARRRRDRRRGRERAASEKTAGEVTKAGGRAHAVKADVSKSADAKAMVDAAEQKFGRLDVLMNNAGILQSTTTARPTPRKRCGT